MSNVLFPKANEQLKNSDRIEKNFDTIILLLVTLLVAYGGFYATPETYSYSIVVYVIFLWFYKGNNRIKNICLGLVLIISSVVMFKNFYPELWTKTFYPESYQTQQDIKDIIKQAQEFSNK